MHIAFLTSEYPPLPSGGIGTSIRNLAQAMVAQGHRVSVLGWGKNSEFEDKGVNVLFMRATSVPKMGWLLNRRYMQQELNGLITEENIDIIEAQDWCGISAGMHLQRPLVIRCNGTATYFAHLLNEKVRSSVRWAEGLALKRADSIVAVSDFTARVTKNLFGLKKEVGVIPNGIDTTQFFPCNPDETELDTILYFGTVVRKKGVLDLCRIFSCLVERYPRAKLKFVGRDNPDKQTGATSTWALCRELLSPHALKQTEYLGLQPHERVQDYIRRSSLCVFPSYAEALPLAWMEAMACSKAVIAYDIGWASEVIESDVSGKLVPLGDHEAFVKAIHEMLSDPAQRIRLGIAARHRVESLFDSHVVSRQSIEWYRQVLGLQGS